MPRSLAALLIAAAALLLEACATGDANGRAAYEKSIRRARTALLLAGDADSLAAAAMLTDRQSPDRLILLARASAAAPDRADLVWLHLIVCSQADSCDAQPMEAQLRALDPGNAAAWVTALDRSAKLGGVEMDQTLLAMSHGQRFDIYWSGTIAHVTRAVANTRTMDLPNALVLVIGLAAAEAIPLITVPRAPARRPSWSNRTGSQSAGDCQWHCAAATPTSRR